MNDLGVSLHAHNRKPTFRRALIELLAAGERPQFNPDYLTPNFTPSQTDSPVVGISRTIPIYTTMHPDVEEMVEQETLSWGGPLEDYAKFAQTSLLVHLTDFWDPDVPTLIPHSSGYDSRILSSCLAQMRKDGVDLGRVHFRCRPPEQESFLAIMQRQGWEPHEYSVYDMSGEDPLDVGAWDRPGTSPWLPVTSQINFWRDIVPYEEEENWNLCGGSGGGESVEYPTLGKPPSIGWHYCANHQVNRWFGYFPDGTDWAADIEGRFNMAMFPFFSSAWIAVIANLPDRHLGFHPSGCDTIRAAVLQHFDDNLLDIPRQPRTYSWSISNARWVAMHAHYDRSIFAHTVPGAPSADQLIGELRDNFFKKTSRAERLWRLAALWEHAHEIAGHADGL